MNTGEMLEQDDKVDRQAKMLQVMVVLLVMCCATMRKTVSSIEGIRFTYLTAHFFLLSSTQDRSRLPAGSSRTAGLSKVTSDGSRPANTRTAGRWLPPCRVVPAESRTLKCVSYLVTC
jgi:hypothetical protein